MIAHNGTTNSVPPLRLVAWEITRSCMLSCRHCRAAAEKGPYPGELSTVECKRFIDALSTMGSCIVILTGGEPMMREDIFDIAAYGNSKGLRMVMAPCGLLLDKEACKKLKIAGIARISLSIDGATSASHDAFRGVTGAFDAVLNGIAAARATGLPFQINTTITRTNLAELPDILKMVIQLGAVSFHPFLLVPTGRGKELMDEILPAVEYEKTLHWIYKQQTTAPISIKPTCAPHYYRIAQQAASSAPVSGATVHPHEHSDLNATTKGCLGGQGFAFVSHTGKVQICGFLPLEAGDLRENDFDFNRIWESSKLFKEIRDIDHYHGKCGICNYRTVCGGCRARAYSVYNDYLGEEPFCLYQPIRRDTTDG
jgi:heme b synthase